MSAAVGVTIVKRFTYRGDPNEEYSNTYWFKPVTAPADSAAWRALFDAIVAVEKACYDSTVSVIRGYGYDDDTGHKPADTGSVAPAVWSVDLTQSPESPVPGTLATGTFVRSPGDDAVWVRWKTERKTSPGGKAIYVRKYFHPAFVVSPNWDTVAPGQRTALLALGAKLYDGTLPGSRTITTAGRLDTISAHSASTYVTTRSLKRRGRRP